MANVTYEKEITALLVIDPYNDFISEGGKVWDRLKTVAEENACVPHMLQVVNASRNAQLLRSLGSPTSSCLIEAQRCSRRNSYDTSLEPAPASKDFGYWRAVRSRHTRSTSPFTS